MAPASVDCTTLLPSAATTVLPSAANASGCPPTVPAGVHVCPESVEE